MISLIECVQRNMFDFKHIKPFERSMADAPGAMVLFATPGMLHAGTSLEVFKKWATNDLNMCILPGYVFLAMYMYVLSVYSYCVVGTVGNKLLAGQRGAVSILMNSLLLIHAVGDYEIMILIQ